MEAALLQTQRADRTGQANARNGGSAGTADNVGVNQEQAADRQALTGPRQSLWRKRQLEGARVHERNQKK